MEDNRPPCNWPIDEKGFVFLKDMIEPEGGCRLPSSLRGFKSGVSLVDENGHPADSDDPAADKCNHRDTPEWKAQHARAKVRLRPKKEKHMEEQVQAPTVPEVTVPTKATIAVPAVPSADDLSRIAANAGGGTTGVLMALIAVVGGGGAVWKFLQSKQKASAKKDELAHEARMKELELQADNQKRDDEKHGECKAARDSVASKLVMLDERVTSLSFNVRELQSKLAENQASLESIQAGVNRFKADGFDPEEIIERLDALEESKPKKRTVRR
jgi:hypothetical protein